MKCIDCRRRGLGTCLGLVAVLSLAAPAAAQASGGPFGSSIKSQQSIGLRPPAKHHINEEVDDRDDNGRWRPQPPPALNPVRPPEPLWMRFQRVMRWFMPGF